MSRNGWHRKARTPAEAARTRQYNSPLHRRLRAAIAAIVEAGEASCWRCGRPIPPGSKWHLGHDDHDRNQYRGAECPKCNLTAAARKGAIIANTQRRRRAKRTTRLEW